MTKSPPPVVNMVQCIGQKIKNRLVTFIAESEKKIKRKKSGDMIKKITRKIEH